MAAALRRLLLRREDAASGPEAPGPPALVQVAGVHDVAVGTRTANRRVLGGRTRIAWRTRGQSSQRRRTRRGIDPRRMGDLRIDESLRRATSAGAFARDMDVGAPPDLMADDPRLRPPRG